MILLFGFWLLFRQYYETPEAGPAGILYNISS